MAEQRIPGVPDGLPPDELEKWSNDLVAFLSSERVPANFRPWARAQADQVDAYMASADDLDSAAEAAPVAAAKTLKARPARPASASEGRTMVLEMPETTGKLLLGVLAGLFVLGAIYGIVLLTRGGNDSSSVPASSANANADGTAAPFDDARAAQLMTLIQKDPNDKDALAELGDMNLTASRYTDAISFYTKLAALDPTNKDVMNSISTANLYLNDTASAKDWAQKVLAIDPNDASAHYNLGYVYAAGTPKDLAAAIKEWELVVKLDPTSPQGQTAKTHVDGLTTQVAKTAAAGGTGGTPPPSGSASAATPPPATTAP